MKKLSYFVLLCFATLALYQCSSEDSIASDAQGELIKKSSDDPSLMLDSEGECTSCAIQGTTTTQQGKYTCSCIDDCQFLFVLHDPEPQIGEHGAFLDSLLTVHRTLLPELNTVL